MFDATHGPTVAAGSHPVWIVRGSPGAPPFAVPPWLLSWPYATCPRSMAVLCVRLATYSTLKLKRIKGYLGTTRLSFIRRFTQLDHSNNMPSVIIIMTAR